MTESHTENHDLPNHALEVSPEYIKKMQTEGMWAAMDGHGPEFPSCPYYMTGYKSVR
jgi:hypothetical protein